MATKTKNNLTAAATTNLTSVTTTTTHLTVLELSNLAAYTVYFKIYDKASAPVLASDIPVITIPVPANSNVGKTWLIGLLLTLGYAYAITKGQANTDTTVLAAGDINVHNTYVS